MTDYLIIHSTDDDEQPLYSREVVARLAWVSREFLDDVERAELIRAHRRVGGDVGYTYRDVRNLRRIRRLREQIGLELPAVEVVLHMRQRMVEMLQEMDQVEQEMNRRERELRRQIRELQQHIAEEGQWE